MILKSKEGHRKSNMRSSGPHQIKLLPSALTMGKFSQSSLSSAYKHSHPNSNNSYLICLWPLFCCRITCPLESLCISSLSIGLYRVALFLLVSLVCQKYLISHQTLSRLNSPHQFHYLSQKCSGHHCSSVTLFSTKLC